MERRAGGGGGGGYARWLALSYLATAMAACGIEQVGDEAPDTSPVENNEAALNNNPPGAPFLGSMFHVSNSVAGVHQHYFTGATATMPASSYLAASDQLYTWVWLVDNALPTEIMLQFYGCDSSGLNCNWRQAYWGANNIGSGTQISATLPGTGYWHKLSFNASTIGLTGIKVTGLSFALYGGKAFWDDSGYIAAGTTSEVVWVNDALPTGAVPQVTSDAWTWSAPAPLSPVLGTSVHVSASVANALHRHYFSGATTPMPSSGVLGQYDELYTYVYLPPNDMPSEIMLEFYACDSGGGNCSWNHRVYWGDNKIMWGTNRGPDRVKRTPLLPNPGQWTILSVPAGFVGLTNMKVTGVSFVLYGGSAYWDNTGYKTVVGTPVVPASGVQQSTSYSNEIVWMDDSVPAGATQSTQGGDSWTWTQLTPTGVTVAEYREAPTADNQIIDPVTRNFDDYTLSWSCAKDYNVDAINVNNVDFSSEARYNDPGAYSCQNQNAHLSYTRKTEVWGAMFRPSSLVSGKKYPVVVMVHGDYGSSCSYPAGLISGNAGMSLTAETDDYAKYNGVCGAIALTSAQGSYNGQCVDDGDCLPGLAADWVGGAPNPNHCDTGTGRCVGGGCATCASQNSIPIFGMPIRAHRGYDYIAGQLAKEGYIVFSLNTLMGTRMSGSLLTEDTETRARLVLQSLKRMSYWTSGTNSTPSSLGVNLLNQLDMSRVVLIGHGTGGEAMRSVLDQYRASDSYYAPGTNHRAATNHWASEMSLGIKGIFEIGPTDGSVTDNGGQCHGLASTACNNLSPLCTYKGGACVKLLGTLGVSSAVLVPKCDGVVRDHDGLKVFDRAMMSAGSPTESSYVGPNFKSVLSVWGANSNFFNSEWRRADYDSGGSFAPLACRSDQAPLFTGTDTNSPQQRQTALFSVVNFVKEAFARRGATSMFDPVAAFYDSSGTNVRVDRSYSPWPNPSSEYVALGTSSFTASGAVVATNSQSIPEHETAMLGSKLQWSSNSASNYADSTWTATNLTGYGYLEFQVDRLDNTSGSYANSSAYSNFSIKLVDNANHVTTSSVVASTYVTLSNPTGLAASFSYPSGNKHVDLQTIRVPLSAFTGGSIDLSTIKSLRLVFDQATSSSGTIIVTNVRATRATYNLAIGATAAMSSALYSTTPGMGNDGNADGNYSNGSVFHTSNEAQTPGAGLSGGPYWSVDFGSVKTVKRVVLYNRTDCCTDTLTNFRINYWNGSTWVLATTNSTNTTNVPVITIDLNLSTQKIMVQKVNTNYLYLGEVQVFGF